MVSGTRGVLDGIAGGRIGRAVGGAQTSAASRIVPASTRTVRARNAVGTSSSTAAVTMYLLVACHEVGQSCSATGVEFGEDVVEDQHGIAEPRLRAEQLGGREPQRERERPRLAVRGVPPDRQSANTQHEVVAMRPDECQSAVELGGAAHARAPAGRDRGCRWPRHPSPRSRHHLPESAPLTESAHPISGLWSAPAIAA